jgi:hypothetical protein
VAGESLTTVVCPANDSRDLFCAITLFPHQHPAKVHPRQWRCKQSHNAAARVRRRKFLNSANANVSRKAEDASFAVIAFVSNEQICFQLGDHVHTRNVATIFTREMSRAAVVKRAVLRFDNVAASHSILPDDQTQLVGHNRERT